MTEPSDRREEPVARLESERIEQEAMLERIGQEIANPSPELLAAQTLAGGLPTDPARRRIQQAVDAQSAERAIARLAMCRACEWFDKNADEPGKTFAIGEPGFNPCRIRPWLRICRWRQELGDPGITPNAKCPWNEGRCGQPP